jgi:hypothetical protein
MQNQNFSKWMDRMDLHQTTKQYLVYLQASGLSTKRLASYQRVMADVENFYGPATPLEKFDNSLVLEYVKENDPFECDPLRVERGDVFCKFTLWLMRNHLIPAWASEMQYEEKQAQKQTQKHYLH